MPRRWATVQRLPGRIRSTFDGDDRYWTVGPSCPASVIAQRHLEHYDIQYHPVLHELTDYAGNVISPTTPVVRFATLEHALYITIK